MKHDIGNENGGLVTAGHRQRKAAIYVRQSTEEQVLHNTGSTAYQRGLADQAKALGWPEERIELFEDLGLSGAAVAHRQSIVRLHEEIAQNRIGAVFVSNFSRLNRCLADFIAFVDLCERHDVLIVDNGRIVNAKRHGDRFTANILGLVADYENSERRSRMEQGRLAKLRNGVAISLPPVGFNPDWTMVDDDHVKSVIRLVFDLALQLGSALRVVKALRSRGVDLPRQNTGRPIHWSPATASAVSRLLRNPAYVGDYAYGRRRSDPALGRDKRGRLRVRSARPDEFSLIRDHHAAYVARDHWERIQQMLTANTWKKGQQRCGEGAALLTGLLRCKRHGYRLHPVYKGTLRDGRPNYGYSCIGRTARAEGACPTIAGRQLDRLVCSCFFDRVSPPSIQELREVWRAAEDSLDERRRERIDRAARLDGEADKLEVLLTQIAPDQTLLLKSIMQKAEDARRRAREAESSLSDDAEAQQLFDEAGFDELAALASEAQAIWEADTTTNRDRKQLLGTLVKEIAVTDQRKGMVELHVDWQDGTPSTVVRWFRSPHAHRIIDELSAKGLGDEDIAAHLDREGIRTKYDSAWTAAAVRQQRNRARRARRRKME